MNILQVETKQIKKEHEVKIKYKNKVMDFYVTTINGEVIGSSKDNLRTSYLTYFNQNSQAIKDKHFQQIKNHINLLYNETT